MFYIVLSYFFYSLCYLFPPDSFIQLILSVFFMSDIRDYPNEAQYALNGGFYEGLDGELFSP